MASTQAELLAEVRTLTNYDTSLISDSDLGDVVDLAKEELKAETSNTSLSFFGSDTFPQDRALFWLSCLFAKVKTGEIAGIDITIGDIRSVSLSGDENFWRHQFEKRLGQIDSARGYGVSTISRDDRVYGA